MFFSLSKTEDLRFPFANRIGSWIFNHDAGWQQTADGWIKGYRYEDIDHGNFCTLRLEDDVIYLDHDKERSFPLWWDADAKILTNCLGQGQSIWADKIVNLTSTDLNFNSKNIVAPIDLSPLSLDNVVTLAKQNLTAKFKKLQQDPRSKKLFLSGGIDTLMLLNFLRAQRIEAEILDYEHFEYDLFCSSFLSRIKENHWAYQRIHHWRDGCVLLTGSCGDEYMFRGPWIIALWTAWHDIDFVDMLTKSQGYHKHYFLLPKNKKIFKQNYRQRKQLQEQFVRVEDLVSHLIDRNLNDHQHWHLGNTMTWTPFKDIELFKLVLRLKHDQLLEHFRDATVCRMMIDFDLLDILSTSKNYQSRQFLHRLQS